MGWQVAHFREAEPQVAAKLEKAVREFSEGRAGALPPEPAVGGAPDGPDLLGTDTDGRPPPPAALQPPEPASPAAAEAPSSQPPGAHSVEVWSVLYCPSAFSNTVIKPAAAHGGGSCPAEHGASDC